MSMEQLAREAARDIAMNTECAQGEFIQREKAAYKIIFDFGQKVLEHAKSPIKLIQDEHGVRLASEPRPADAAGCAMDEVNQKQEWTVVGATVVDYQGQAVYVCDTHNGAKHLAGKHNAALAAERDFSPIAEKLLETEKQLAAERENNDTQAEAYVRRINELRTELDLEKRQCAFESEHREKYRTRAIELTREQEWTVSGTWVRDASGLLFPTPSADDARSAASFHNAALAAERERRENAERDLSHFLHFQQAKLPDTWKPGEKMKMELDIQQLRTELANVKSMDKDREYEMKRLEEQLAAALNEGWNAGREHERKCQAAAQKEGKCN